MIVCCVCSRYTAYKLSSSEKWPLSIPIEKSWPFPQFKLGSAQSYWLLGGHQQKVTRSSLAYMGQLVVGKTSFVWKTRHLKVQWCNGIVCDYVFPSEPTEIGKQCGVITLSGNQFLIEALCAVKSLCPGLCNWQSVIDYQELEMLVTSCLVIKNTSDPGRSVEFLLRNLDWYLRMCLVSVSVHVPPIPIIIGLLIFLVNQQLMIVVIIFRSQGSLCIIQYLVNYRLN